MSNVLKQASDNDDDVDTNPPVLPRAKRLVRRLYSSTDNQLEASLDSAPSVVYECAEDLTVLSVSANAVELLGVRPARLMGNRTLWDARLISEDRRGLLARLDQLRAGEVAFETHRIVDDRGLLVWVSHGLRKVNTASGTIIRGCMMPLPPDFHFKGIDSGIISQFVHKIGNHFQLMNLLIGSLKRGVKATSEMDTLQETVDRAVEFMRAFLHYSQASAGSLEVDVGDILRAAMDSTAPFFVERKVMLKDLVGESLNGALVNGDPVLLELAFRAILQNALDATSSGDRVVISGKHQATPLAGQSVARISIADSGHGMESELLEKASVPFFTSKPERDGLGLSIAVRVVELHGGRLTISSSRSDGTKVEILLPLHAAKDRAARHHRR